MSKNMDNSFYYFYYHHDHDHCYHYKRPCCNDRTRAFVLCFFFFFFFFLLLCGFILFYAFNVSPCDVMSDVRFLFLFSNTIILVIAADFGAFASVENAEEETYGKVAAAEGPVPCSVVVEIGGYAESDDSVRELAVMGADSPKEEGNVVEGDITVPGRSEEVGLMLTYNDVGSCDEDGEGSMLADDQEVRVVGRGEENDELSWMVNGADIGEDDGERSMMADEEEEERDVAGKEEENDEFSLMSDEELNQRVEEFIHRLKKQIWQQAARDAE